MVEVIENNPRENSKPADISETGSGFFMFQDLDLFSKAVEAEVGITFDFAAVVELNTNFLQSAERYLIVDIKEYLGEITDNLLFLTEDKAFLFARTLPQLENIKIFRSVLNKPFGRSTVLTFLTLSMVLNTYKQRLENLNNIIREMEENFDLVRYRTLSQDFERLHDRLEEYHDLLLQLQESRYEQVNTEYVSFDYRVLINESLSVQGRCRRRLTTLKELRQDYETRATADLNNRIARLNDVVKRLTALTVLLMVPNLIASHFGMNFARMPELQMWWAYPAVVVAQILIVAVGFFAFKKMNWL